MTGESFKTKMFRHALNLYPMFFGTGGRLTFLKADYTHASVRLKLGFWTRNYVGTIFGGSMFAAADPFPMVLLINILGKEFVVWDKSAKIDFKRPGKGILKAEFIYTPEEIKSIKEAVLTTGSFEYVKSVSWINAEGKVVSTVDKTLYIATKVHFRQRRENKLSTH